MRVFYDHQIFSTQRQGGISRYFSEIIKGVAEQPDVDVSLFAGPYVFREGMEQLRSCVSNFFGFRRPRMGLLWNVTAPMACFGAAYFLHRWDADIYHPTNYAQVSCPAGVKRILTVHDMIPEKFPQFYPDGLVVAEKRRAIEASDAFLCVSESTRNDLIEYFPDAADRSVVIYHGVSMKPPVGLPTKPNKPYFLYVGPRHSYKNFNLLVEAFQSIADCLPDCELLCVGGNPFSKEEQNTFRARNLAGVIRQISADDESLSRLYAGALAFVYPSLYEGFGIPVIEAMACGCPVICGNTSSLPEAGGTAALYFNPQSSEELASHMKQIINDGQLKSELVAEGLRHAESFTWKRAVDMTLASYKQLAQARRAPN